jgi:hypothetical protein
MKGDTSDSDDFDTGATPRTASSSLWAFVAVAGVTFQVTLRAVGSDKKTTLSNLLYALLWPGVENHFK